MVSLFVTQEFGRCCAFLQGVFCQCGSNLSLHLRAHEFYKDFGALFKKQLRYGISFIIVLYWCPGIYILNIKIMYSKGNKVNSLSIDPIQFDSVGLKVILDPGGLIFVFVMYKLSYSYKDHNDLFISLCVIKSIFPLKMAKPFTSFLKFLALPSTRMRDPQKTLPKISLRRQYSSKHIMTQNYEFRH